jgi:hypothetical protein
MTKPEIQKYTMILQPRDILMLKVIGKFDFTVVNVIAQWAGFTSYRYCQERLTKLVNNGFVKRWDKGVTDGSIYSLTSSGWNVIGHPEKRTKKNAPVATWEHDLIVQILLTRELHQIQHMPLDSFVTENYIKGLLNKKDKEMHLKKSVIKSRWQDRHVPDALYYGFRLLNETHDMPVVTAFEYEKSRKSLNKFKRNLYILNKELLLLNSTMYWIFPTSLESRENYALTPDKWRESERAGEIWGKAEDIYIRPMKQILKIKPDPNNVPDFLKSKKIDKVTRKRNGQTGISTDKVLIYGGLVTDDEGHPVTKGKTTKVNYDLILNQDFEFRDDYFRITSDLDNIMMRMFDRV